MEKLSMCLVAVIVRFCRPSWKDWKLFFIVLLLMSCHVLCMLCTMPYILVTPSNQTLYLEGTSERIGDKGTPPILGIFINPNTINGADYTLRLGFSSHQDFWYSGALPFLVLQQMWKLVEQPHNILQELHVVYSVGWNPFCWSFLILMEPHF